MKYKPTIGLEIHAELKTETKMFCGSKNDPDEKRPNVNVCPVCLGYPGTLPVINKQAVKHVLRIGVAVGGELADFSEFDRKNYFYPDIPKGYQISQYQYPLVRGGNLLGVRIKRIHLEEDTARSTHHPEHSLIDFNRAGVPLMELVTEPVIGSGTSASAFARELQLILQYLGASESNMEKGEMRVEANISLSVDNKLEAIDFEIERQSRVLEKGEKIHQETRGWDESEEETFSQRVKEESHDYRYFPDPDLPKLRLSLIPDFSPETLRRDLPELPAGRRARFKERFGLSDEDVEVYVSTEWGKYFEAAAGILVDRKAIKLASNYIRSDLLGLVKKDANGWRGQIALPDFAELIKMIAGGQISSRGAKDILLAMYESGGRPAEIAKAKSLLQISDQKKLREAAEKVISENPKAAGEFKAGKEASLQFLVGRMMKASGGAANPKEARKILLDFLK
ncbi:MAG: Asp-tRNA(Asn)/Glu-tRNA(Gln) amidotransferase subunit GatB [Candidatus Taylorbacteria bacterium]|nr:Asp-tRNA(Asn)/Glu-tRNA(Gln) amidotransferase subunit GatB [Candidatus Taylorbacteria bacterium]